MLKSSLVHALTRVVCWTSVPKDPAAQLSLNPRHVGQILWCHITEELRLAGTSGSMWFNPCSSSDTQSRVPRLFRRVLQIPKEDLQILSSTIILGNLCQCSVTLRGKKFLLMLDWNCLWLSLCPCSLVAGHRWVWLHPLDNFPLDTH